MSHGEIGNDNMNISDPKEDSIFKDIIARWRKGKIDKKEIVFLKDELQLIKDYIDIARDRLYEAISQEAYLTSEEVIKTSQQLDELIQVYNSIRIQIQDKEQDYA